MHATCMQTKSWQPLGQPHNLYSMSDFAQGGDSPIRFVGNMHVRSINTCGNPECGSTLACRLLEKYLFFESFLYIHTSGSGQRPRSSQGPNSKGPIPVLGRKLQIAIGGSRSLCVKKTTGARPLTNIPVSILHSRQCTLRDQIVVVRVRRLPRILDTFLHIPTDTASISVSNMQFA